MPYKVFLVDDEPLFLDGMAQMIDWESIGLCVAGSALAGNIALSVLEQEPVDILITDIHMPHMDGLQLLTSLEACGKLPLFIVLSGHDDFNYVKQAMRLGAENYLLKPVDSHELIETLECLVRKLDLDRVDTTRDRNVMLNNLLMRWSVAGLHKYELRERAELLMLKIDYIAYQALLLHLPGQTIEKYQDTVHDVFQPSHGNMYHILNDVHENMLIIALYSDDKYNKQGELLLLECQKMISSMGIHCNSYIGPIKTNIDSLSESYHFAEAALLNDVGQNTRETQSQSPIIQEIIKYLQVNYGNMITLSSIAQRYHINATYLGQLFKKETKHYFLHTLNSVRISSAIELLQSTSWSTSEIALRVGFDNANYFHTVFKRMTGTTPKEYRYSMPLKTEIRN